MRPPTPETAASPASRRWRVRAAIAGLSAALACTAAAQTASAPVLPDAVKAIASPESAKARPLPPGTVRMIERFAGIRAQAEANPAGQAYTSAEHAALLQRQLAVATEPGEVGQLMSQYGQQLLNWGRSEDAKALFEQFEAYMDQHGIDLGPRQRDLLRMLRATCMLRLGEQENCIVNHNAESCLFPIRGGGVHLLPRGSQGAIRLFNELLERRPTDLRARWLLNIAHMTLGQWPDQVPARWVIPPERFASDHDIKHFPDVAGPLGLDGGGLAGGVILEDFDGDGFLDVMTSTWELKGLLKLFHNNGDGTFSERTDEAGLTGFPGGLNIQQTDYDNDGRPDVFVLRGGWLGPAGRHPNSLLHNNGDGSFTDVTEAAGLLSFHPTQTAAWLDYDGDGWLDVFIGNESSGPQDVHACELFHNNRDGTFTECAAACGIAVVGFVKGVATGDIDNDGRPDLYLSRLNEPNLLFRNAGPRAGGTHGAAWSFENVTTKAGVGEPPHSFPTAVFDYDDDGWEDIVVSGYGIRNVGDVAADYLGLPSEGERMRLFRNQHDGTFRDVTKEVGLFKVVHAMGWNFGDLDNDGWLDFYAGTGNPDLTTLIPNRMFRNDGGKRFQEVTTSGGFGQLQKGHGLAFADLDNDGDQDIYSVVGGANAGDVAHNQLFLNPGHGNHWVTLKLEGRASNRAALGARIKVDIASADGPRSIRKTVSTGGSFGSSPFRQEIGLGKATAITGVEVFWPTTGKRQTFTGLQPDRFYKIVEGQAEAVPWDVKKVQFDLTAKAGHPHDHAAAPVSAAP